MTEPQTNRVVDGNEGEAVALAGEYTRLYSPGDYESPRTAPFVQVRVNGELVPGHIVYPWPDGGLVVEPLEVAG